MHKKRNGYLIAILPLRRITLESTNIYDRLQDYFVALLRQNALESESIVVQARTLTPQEAIGNPEDDDYPILIGRERIVQAEFRGSFGHAFTDMFGNHSGRAIDIAEMKLSNNFRRAIFVASLNAVMRNLGLVDKTVHCRDDEPRECSQMLAEYLRERYGSPRIAMAGMQPRMVEALAKAFEIRVTDLDSANIGSEHFGVVIHGPDETKANLDWCDIALVTGTTIVNNTIGEFLIEKPVIFFGVTIAGAAEALGLQAFCHCGT